MFRSLLSVLLLAALGSCTLYHKVHHPYRLPTPKPSPEFKAQQEAAAKARKNRKQSAGDVTKNKSEAMADESATDISTPTASARPAPVAATAEARTLPERPTVKYDKEQMLKKPKLMRRRRHNKGKPFRPIESIRNFFKYGLHAKPNYSIDHRPTAKPAAEPTDAPADTPDATPDNAPAGKP